MENQSKTGRTDQEAYYLQCKKIPKDKKNVYSCQCFMTLISANNHKINLVDKSKLIPITDY